MLKQQQQQRCAIIYQVANYIIKVKLFEAFEHEILTIVPIWCTINRIR